MSKRPVAFRVPRLCGDIVSHYFVTTSEDEARAMADTNQVEYEGLYLVGDRAAFECAARKQSLPEPAECNWPVCGCDPYADKVISALEESGHFPAQPQEAPETAEAKWMIADGKRITGETLIFDGTFIVAIVTRREDAERIVAAVSAGTDRVAGGYLEALEAVQSSLALSSHHSNTGDRNG